MGKSLRLFAIGCLLVLIGSAMAHTIQTTNGVSVRDVRYRDADGTWMSGLLYTPKTATAQHPAPVKLTATKQHLTEPEIVGDCGHQAAASAH